MYEIVRNKDLKKYIFLNHRAGQENKSVDTALCGFEAVWCFQSSELSRKTTS